MGTNHPIWPEIHLHFSQRACKIKSNYDENGYQSYQEQSVGRIKISANVVKGYCHNYQTLLTEDLNITQFQSMKIGGN